MFMRAAARRVPARQVCIQRRLDLQHQAYGITCKHKIPYTLY